MLKSVRVFGVRKRINQLVEAVNGLLTLSSRLDDLNRVVHRLSRRVEGLERWANKADVFKIFDEMAQSLDDEMLLHVCEQVERLERRIAALENDKSNTTADAVEQIRRELRRRRAI